MSGRVYRTVVPAYRVLQRLKNAALRLVDAPVVVLLYHRVAALAFDPDLLAVSPDNFFHQLTYLKEHFRLVRLEDDWTDLAEPAVAVTFDDGYADNLREALPILEQVGVPATFFVSTGQIGTGQEFWWDRMARLLLGSAAYPASFTLEDREHGRSWPTGTPEQRRRLYDELNALGQTIDAERMADWLAQLAARVGPDHPANGLNRVLEVAELQALAQSPWATIGAHAVSHTALSALSEERQRHEIFASKAALEQATGTRVQVFSYPFGNRRHYDERSLGLCREAGFVKAAANFPGQVHRWTDPYQLPRQVVRNWDLEGFAGRMRNWV